MHTEGKKENRSHGNDRAVRQAYGFRVLDVQLLPVDVGRPAVTHLAEDVPHIPDGLLKTAARDHHDQSHDAAHRAVPRKIANQSCQPTNDPTAPMSFTSPAPIARKA